MSPLKLRPTNSAVNHWPATVRLRHSAIMNGTGLDHDGPIEREGDLARVPQAFAPVIEATKAAFLRAFGPSRLQRLPLRKHPQGHAVPEVSDLDVLLALHDEPTDGDRAAASRLHVLSRGVGRCLVRTGFTLVMPRWGGWTSDLDESATVFGGYYPGRRNQMQAAAAVARTPTADSSVLGMLINDLGPWPAAEYTAVHGRKTPRV